MLGLLWQHLLHCKKKLRCVSTFSSSEMQLFPLVCNIVNLCTKQMNFEPTRLSFKQFNYLSAKIFLHKVRQIINRVKFAMDFGRFLHMF